MTEGLSRSAKTTARSAIGGRHLDPELAEMRELLALAALHVEGEPAGRKAVFVVAAEEAEIARAEERDELVEDLRVVEGVVQAKAREAEIDRQRPLDLGAAGSRTARAGRAPESAPRRGSRSP